MLKSSARQLERRGTRGYVDRQGACHLVADTSVLSQQSKSNPCQVRVTVNVQEQTKSNRYQTIMKIMLIGLSIEISSIPSLIKSDKILTELEQTKPNSY